MVAVTEVGGSILSVPVRSIPMTRTFIGTILSHLRRSTSISTK